VSGAGEGAEGAAADAVSSATFYPRLRRFLREGDMVFSDTGLSVGPLASMRLPDRATFHYQTLWGSIGWATGAAFGASLADRSRRTVLVTGDGAHQMTANDLGAMGRYGATPVIFVLNNGVYGIEEVLSRRQGHVYDEIAPWSYAKLPEAMGCRGWFTARVETVGELDEALRDASDHDGACYVEIVLDRRDLPPTYAAPVLDTLYETAPHHVTT
jgi:indolepyruvate decarboxylase